MTDEQEKQAAETEATEGRGQAEASTRTRRRRPDSRPRRSRSLDARAPKKDDEPKADAEEAADARPRSRAAEKAEAARLQAEKAPLASLAPRGRQGRRRRRPTRPRRSPRPLAEGRRRQAARAARRPRPGPYVRSSARKARLVCDHIRGKDVDEARRSCATRRAPWRATGPSCSSPPSPNAEHNHELVGDDLQRERGLRRRGPDAQALPPARHGRATRIRKRTHHLTIKLTPKE
jgi:ribosomal protein L22